MRNPEESFHKNTTRNQNGCLDFNKSPYPNGYGRILISRKKYQSAHRFAWEMHYGEIPEGMCVLHKCDRPVCCEISHLFLGTAKDNAIDREKKGRRKARKGHDHPMNKLSDEQIFSIKKMLIEGVSVPELTKLFLVNRATIGVIKRCEQWIHVGEELNDKLILVKHKKIIGEDNCNSKLKKDQVIEIKNRIFKGETCLSISKIYDVSSVTIDMIKHNKTWRHVNV